MEHKTYNILDFDLEPDHFKSFDVLLTIKSFDLQAIRKRYIASKKNRSGKAGSVERRPVSIGGIVYGQLSSSESSSFEELIRMKEPRGIDADGERLAIAAEDRVSIYDKGKSYDLTHPWFSYIHTVKFSPFDPKKVLIASSGLDIILEVDYVNKEVSFEWLAWEHGYPIAHDPKTKEEVLLTRDSVQFEEYMQKGQRAKLIDDPKGEVLPTAMRAAFINSIAYERSNPEVILATFFHEGKVLQIDRKSGHTKEVVSALKNPHGGVKIKNEYFATSTASGELVFQNENERIEVRFDGLPGKPEALKNLEWLQNSMPAPEQGQVFLTIDSNRNQFVLWDLKARKRAHMDYGPDWAVQDMVAVNLSPEEKDWIKNL